MKSRKFPAWVRFADEQPHAGTIMSHARKAGETFELRARVRTLFRGRYFRTDRIVEGIQIVSLAYGYDRPMIQYVSFGKLLDPDHSYILGGVPADGEMKLVLHTAQRDLSNFECFLEGECLDANGDVTVAGSCNGRLIR